MKKKIIISIILIAICVICYTIYLKQKSENILATYSLNNQGLLRNDKNIIEEKYDENGNLIYYKYQKDNNSEIKEVFINYKYDSDNRIITVDFNNKSNIQIKYNENNLISELIENNTYDNYSENIQYICKYSNSEENNIIVNKEVTIKSNNNEINDTKQSILDFETLNINNKDYILLTEKTNENEIYRKTLYEKNNMNTDYTNIHNELNIVFLGYISNKTFLQYGTQTENSSYYIEPIFYNGKHIYTKYNYSNCKSDTYFYYDAKGRLLKSEYNENNKNISVCNINYKDINEKEYYEYILEKNNDSITYTKNKVFLNEKYDIIKKETLELKNISEKEYNSKIDKFEKYFKQNVSDVINI